MKTFWYYAKQTFVPIMYLIMFDIIALGILCIGDNLVALKVVLLVLNLGLYGFIMCAVSFKDGQTALKVRMANDLNREQIVKTGKELPLKLKEEYKPWKGFLMGLNVCVPLIICMILHVILTAGKDPALASTTNTAGAISGLLYVVFFGFSQVKSTVAIISTTYYVSLVAIPFFVGCIGVSYWLGGEKIVRQQEMIKEKHRQIYGD
jgi:hypothetical protein